MQTVLKKLSNICCLNPCFNGICSARKETIKHSAPVSVLILVLMEYALRVLHVDLRLKVRNVLILVLMEYALRVTLQFLLIRKYVCLNPCFNGICSARVIKMNARCHILVS